MPDLVLKCPACQKDVTLTEADQARLNFSCPIKEAYRCPVCDSVIVVRWIPNG